MNQEIERLLAAVKDAHTALNTAVEKEFPVGSRVRWMFQDTYPQTGVVIYNNQGGEIDHTRMEVRVNNDRTGRDVWVRLWMNPERIDEE